MSVEFSNYEINIYVEIFNNDKLLTETLEKYNIYEYDEDIRRDKYVQIYKLIKTYENKMEDKDIQELTLDRFLWEKRPFTYTGIKDILLQETDLEDIKYNQEILYNIFLAYKYGTIKKFFFQNYKQFIPEIDFQKIQESSKTKIFIESFIKEFDKMSSVIDNISTLKNIDEIPTEYLAYMGQLIGYENTDRNILKDSSLRELLKNIIEIYRIKGTNYSFELFFNFLGFDIELVEFYFDRRYGHDSVSGNPYTNATDKNDYSWYLTPNNPIDSFPDGYTGIETVSPTNFIPYKNLEEFTRLSKIEGKYTFQQLLGYQPGYTESEFNWTYFKTNIIKYDLKPFRLSDGSYKAITGDVNETLDEYIKFLTPIFLTSISVLTAPSIEEQIPRSVYFKDKIGKKSFLQTIGNVYKFFNNEFDYDDAESSYFKSADFVGDYQNTQDYYDGNTFILNKAHLFVLYKFDPYESYSIGDIVVRKNSETNIYEMYEAIIDISAKTIGDESIVDFPENNNDWKKLDQLNIIPGGQYITRFWTGYGKGSQIINGDSSTGQGLDNSSMVQYDFDSDDNTVTPYTIKSFREHPNKHLIDIIPEVTEVNAYKDDLKDYTTTDNPEGLVERSVIDTEVLSIRNNVPINYTNTIETRNGVVNEKRNDGKKFINNGTIDRRDYRDNTDINYLLQRVKPKHSLYEKRIDNDKLDFDFLERNDITFNSDIDFSNTNINLIEYFNYHNSSYYNGYDEEFNEEDEKEENVLIWDTLEYYIAGSEFLNKGNVIGI